MIPPVSPSALSSIPPTIPRLSAEEPSVLSQVVSRVLSDIQTASSAPTSPRLLPHEEQMDQSLSGTITLLEGMASSSAPLSDAVLHVLLNTDMVQQLKSEGDLAAKRRSFFDLMITETKARLSSLSPVEDVSSGAAMIEEMILGHDQGSLSRVNAEVETVFSHIGTAKDVLNLLSLSGACVYYAFRADVLRHIHQKIDELKEAASKLPTTEVKMRSKIQEQITTLSEFLKVEQKALMGALGKEFVKSVPKLLNVTRFILVCASKTAEAGSHAAKALKTAGTVVGQIAAAVGVIQTGVEMYQVGRTFVRYEKWLEVLQNRLNLILPEVTEEPAQAQLLYEEVSNGVYEEMKPMMKTDFFSSTSAERETALAQLRESVQTQMVERLKKEGVQEPEEKAKKLTADVMERLLLHAVEKNAESHFQDDERVKNPSPSPEKRAEAFQELKHEMRTFITSELKTLGVSQAEGRAELCAHIQIRKICQDLAVKESGSEEQARKKEMLSASIKSGLTNLAMAKREVEKSLYKGAATFHVMDAALSVGLFVTTLLGILAVLVPPISSFVALGLMAGGALLFAATLIYERVTRPNVFKATWGSQDGWTGFFSRIRAKYYGWRLEKAKLEATQLEQKLAPTCFKIAILQKLLSQGISNKGAVLSLMGLSGAVQGDEQKTREAIQAHIDSLKQTISPKDSKKLSALKGRITHLTSKTEELNKKIKDMEKRLEQAYERDNIEWMKKQRDWSSLETMLADFKEGIADHLVGGEEFCLTLLHELHESTGIRFDIAEIDKALSQRTSMLEARNRAHDADKSVSECEKRLNTARQAGDTGLIKRTEEGLQMAREAQNLAHQVKADLYQNLLRVIGEPISHFVARAEGDFKEIPAVLQRKKV